MQSIRVVLADDHTIFRKGVKSILEDEPGIVVIGEASNGIEAVEKVRELAPEILIIDVSMPKMNGIEAAKIVDKQFKATKTLVLSMHHNEDYVVKSVEAGAYGYLLKDTTKQEMVDAIKKIAAGEKYFNSGIASLLVDGLVSKRRKGSFEDGNGGILALSRKERVIMKYIIDGLSSKQIAEKEKLSVRTVDNHRANMMKKMKVKNAAEMVRLALELKLVI
ncbi:MAG: response regulator transcription factor [Cytophagales bacterium]